MQKRQDDRVARAAETFRFCVVGACGTVLYFGLATLLGATGIPAAIASGGAFVVVACCNYLLHRGWTYRSGVGHARAFPAFLASTALGFGINVGVVWLGAQHLGLPCPWVQAVAVAMVVLFNLACGRAIFRPRGNVTRGSSHVGCHR